MPEKTFADRLKEAMARQGKKQVDLIRAAAEQGVKLGKSHMSQYVSGKTIPRTDILHFLADALQVDANWLKGEAPVPEAGNGGAGEQDGESRNAAGKEKKYEKDGETPPGGRKMREIKKSSKLDNVLYDVRGPVVDEAERMEESGTQILKLNIGNPAPFGFRTPDEVIYDMRRQLTECEGYSPAKGLFSGPEGDHAVCAAEEDSQCFDGRHLYGERRQRAD